MLILESAFTIVLPLVLGATALALLPWSDGDIARVDGAAQQLVRTLASHVVRLSRPEPLVRDTIRSS